MRNVLSLGLGLAAVAVAAISNAASADITLINPEGNIIAVGEDYTGTNDSAHPAALDYSKNLHAGDTVFSDMKVTLTQAGFNFDISQDNPFEVGQTAASAGLYFHASTNYTYTLTGHFNVTGIADGEIDSEFDAKLSDSSITTPLFAQETFQAGTPASLVLGASEHSGSLTGNILAGHDYYFSFFAGFGAITDPSGVGNVNLSFVSVGTPPNTGGGTAVPLPPAAFAGLLALAPAGFAARRFRQRA